MAEARRTQDERSTATRAALLAATVDCLVEYGYAGTTTRVVADRAGVSRGAQTHHYPSKHDLVVAAIEHLFAEQAAGFAAAFAAVPPQARTFDRAVASLWDIVTGPTYAAVLEVVVAARTDDELRVVVHGVAAGLEATVVDLLVELFPGIGGAETAAAVVDLAFALVQGAAVSSYGGYGNPEAVIALTRAMATLLTPDTLPALLAAYRAGGSAGSPTATEPLEAP
jgi:AcrR family transcriptional regulator